MNHTEHRSRKALEELKRLDSVFITAAQAAPVIGCDPALIRWQAHNDPQKLGFPVTVLKQEVRIPRLPLIEFASRLFSEEIA